MTQSVLRSSRTIQQAASPKRDIWVLANRVLYQLCRRYPEHRRVEEVVAKASLIGRAYAAAIERGVPNEPGRRRDTTEFYRHKVAQPLCRSGIDRHIEVIRKIRVLNEENGSDVLKAHKRLLDVLFKSVGQEKRSFASKYLHFHAHRAVPIYDAYAVSTLREYVPGRIQLPVAWKAQYDREYTVFLMRYLHFRNDLEQRYGLQLTPKQVDRLLWRVPRSKLSTSR